MKGRDPEGPHSQQELALGPSCCPGPERDQDLNLSRKGCGWQSPGRQHLGSTPRSQTPKAPVTLSSYSEMLLVREAGRAIKDGETSGAEQDLTGLFEFLPWMRRKPVISYLTGDVL